MLKPKTVRQKSQAQERRIAKQVKGQVVKGSGCLFYAKGDVKMEEFLIEAKTTDADSFTLKAEVIEKIMEEAIAIGKEGFLQINFRKRNLDVAVVPWMNFQLMLDDTKTVMSMGQRNEMLERVIKILVYRMFEKELVESTDEVFEYLSGRLAAIAKDPTALPNVDVRI